MPLIQPIDQGILRAFKQHYTNKWFSKKVLLQVIKISFTWWTILVHATSCSVTGRYLMDCIFRSVRVFQATITHTERRSTVSVHGMQQQQNFFVNCKTIYFLRLQHCAIPNRQAYLYFLRTFKLFICTLDFRCYLNERYLMVDLTWCCMFLTLALWLWGELLMLKRSLFLT